MTDIIAIANQKGGVAKSTTALALGEGLRRKGKRTLFVDLDPQGNLSYALGASGVGVHEVLTGRASAAQAVAGDVLCSSPQLAGADVDMRNTGKEYRLREALDGIRQRYDAVVIDTPPALGILTVNALTAATSLIIPAQADVFSLQGIAQLQATVDAVKKYCNPGLAVRGILLTRFSARTVLSRDVAELMARVALGLNTKVFGTAIRESVAVREAQMSRAPLFTYAPKANAALDYLNFVEEYLEGIQP